jgi:P2-related tail formation protein
MTSGRGPSSLLPPNATDFEKALEHATRFGAEASLLNGFKFKENQRIVNYLIWEYNLNDVLEYIKNSTNFIADGLVFQRTRGTRVAINIATNWAGLNNVDIYEEGPSAHFYEFQIGVKDRQFDFDIELLKNVISLAKPVRSRLSRVYNDVHDIRYFKLDGSAFGDILSDNSGAKLHDLTLSFGRESRGAVVYNDGTAQSGVTRFHAIKSAADRIYRLDFVVLDESEPDIDAIGIEYQKVRIYEANAYGFGKLEDIGHYLTFAKAAVVLSESSILEDINTCFNPLEIVEKYATFMLGEDLLSEHFWGFETKWILERFGRSAGSYVDFSDAEYFCTSPRICRDFAKVVPFEMSSTSSLKSRLSATYYTAYEPNLCWSEHQHQDRAWDDEIHIAKLH